MIRIANDRIFELFALAEREARPGPSPLASRYVQLARRIGTRYNVRIPRELGEQYCRGCSTYWVEGRNVRTRFRGGRRVRTCLVCGRVRRQRWGETPWTKLGVAPAGEGGPGSMSAVAPVDDHGADEELDFDDGEEP